jgi:hypothetical protein
MPNSANEAKRLWRETFHVKEHFDYAAMDSKADDFGLFRKLKGQRKMNLNTYCRQNMDESPHRKKMIQFMQNPKHQKTYRERSCRVKPMQGIVKNIFDLEPCWMRGKQNNRWLFAAMGLAIQMHRLDALKK